MSAPKLMFGILCILSNTIEIHEQGFIYTEWEDYYVPDEPLENLMQMPIFEWLKTTYRGPGVEIELDGCIYFLEDYHDNCYQAPSPDDIIKSAQELALDEGN